MLLSIYIIEMKMNVEFEKREKYYRKKIQQLQEINLQLRNKRIHQEDEERRHKHTIVCRIVRIILAFIQILTSIIWLL